MKGLRRGFSIGQTSIFSGLETRLIAISNNLQGRVNGDS